MTQRSWSLTTVGLLVMVATLAAVADPPQPVERPDRPGQDHRRPHNPMKYMKMLESFEKEIVRALDLDEDLANEIADLFDEHLAATREEMDTLQQRRRESAEEIRLLVRSLRDAQASGDQEGAARIREEIVELRRQQLGTAHNHDELFQAVRELLDKKQLETFNEYAKRFEARLSGPDQGNAGILRLRRALDMLDLSKEQHARTREIVSKAMREIRSVRSDPEKTKELETSLHAAIIEELDEDQTAQFEESLAELAKEGKRPRKSEVSDRDARPTRPDRDRASDSDRPEEAAEPDEAEESEVEVDEAADEEEEAEAEGADDAPDSDADADEDIEVEEVEEVED